MMSSKGKKSPLMLISLILIINILISTIFLPCMAFASPPPPLSGCAFASHDCHYKPTEAIHHNRKIAMGVMGSTRSEVDLKKGVKKYEEELRNVPSGPDPLHHNGAPQKRSKPSP